MGYLDHSTNNIILDAVLTDYGRQLLSTAGSSNTNFKISAFSLGDDEVDYAIIKKYGRAVGKEKIEKNTPIFEAMTNQSIALKYPLVASETASALATAFLPTLEKTAPSSVVLTPPNNTQVNVSLSLKFKGSSDPNQLSNYITDYVIKISDRFFYLANEKGGTLEQMGSVDPGDPNRIATYKFKTVANTSNISFDILSRPIDSTTLSIYGRRTSSSQRTISSYVTVIGVRHGAMTTFEVSYVASSA